MIRRTIIFILVCLMSPILMANDSKVWEVVDRIFEHPNFPIQYSSVSEARSSLEKGHDLTFNKESGYTKVRVKNKENSALWTFFPSEHPAYPTVIKTSTYDGDNGILFLEVDVLCDKPSKSCEELKAEAKEMLFNHYAMYMQ